jgi:hypothetical protein
MEENLGPAGCILILPKRPELLPPPFRRALKEVLHNPEYASTVLVIAPESSDEPGADVDAPTARGERIPPVIVSSILLPIATKAANDLYSGVKTVVTDYYKSEQQAKDYITNKYRLADAETT